MPISLHLVNLLAIPHAEILTAEPVIRRTVDLWVQDPVDASHIVAVVVATEAGDDFA